MTYTISYRINGALATAIIQADTFEEAFRAAQEYIRTTFAEPTITDIQPWE